MCPIRVHQPHTLCYLRREYLFCLFFVVSCHCRVRQEPAAAGHRDEHSGRRSSSNDGGQCGQCVLPTVRRSLIVHLFRPLHPESLKNTSNGDTHRYTACSGYIPILHTTFRYFVRCLEKTTRTLASKIHERLFLHNFSALFAPYSSPRNCYILEPQTTIAQTNFEAY